MSFVLPKSYMLHPMMVWGENLLANPSTNSTDVKNFSASMHAHGLNDDDDLKQLLSKLQSKEVESSLSDTMNSLAVNEHEDNEWSEYDSYDTNMEHLNSSDISEHLETISSRNRTRVRQSQTHRLNVRRSGRMRT